MGCIQFNTVSSDEINFCREKTGRNTVIFEFNHGEVENDLKVYEEALCDENYMEAIYFSTHKNDIPHVSKSVLNRRSKKISESAVIKLNERKNFDRENNEIDHDHKKLQRNLRKSVRFVNKELNFG